MLLDGTTDIAGVKQCRFASVTLIPLYQILSGFRAVCTRLKFAIVDKLKALGMYLSELPGATTRSNNVQSLFTQVMHAYCAERII